MVENTEDFVNRLARAFYNQAYIYVCDAKKAKPTAEDLDAAQKTLQLIKQGELKAAALEAGRTTASLQIFEEALKDAENKGVEA